MDDDLDDDFGSGRLDDGDLSDDLGTGADLDRFDADDVSAVDDDLPDMAENFGLDAEPGTKGVKASGAGLSGSVGGNTIRSSNDPDTYSGSRTHEGGAETGGAGI